MNILFIFCEGSHDAQFIGRILEANGEFVEYDKPINEYPSPLDKFISGKFTNHDIASVKLGRPNLPLVPACAFHNKTVDLLVLPIPLGGMDRYVCGINLLGEINNDFQQDVLEVMNSIIKDVSILFVYDADSRGIDNTLLLFKSEERYGNFFDNISELEHKAWHKSRKGNVGVFIFSRDGEEVGTLEDILVKLFKSKDQKLTSDSENIVDQNFEPRKMLTDEVAYISKRNKAFLTICGQHEQKIAGAALTVVIRDTKLLNNAFDFSDETSQWAQLLKLIKEAG